MESNELQRICSALDSLMKPDVDSSTRTEALKLCESYKSDPRSVEIGFQLANSPGLTPNVRYYGLQLIKHRVRMLWTTLASAEQTAIKSLTLNLIATCGIDEPIYIKSLLGSIINEIVKHHWPQLWPTMLDDVIGNCREGNVSASLEITLLFFLALAEDVSLYQNIATKTRAKDLRQALSLASPKMFEFMLYTLRKESQLIVASQTTFHNRLALVALRAMESYLEWINLTVAFVDDYVIFKILFHVIAFEELRVTAAECLLAIVGRKGPFNDRKLLIKLTDDGYVQKLAPAIKLASQEKGFNESNFRFLFVIAKVLSTLSVLLVGLWEDDDKNTEDCPNEMGSRKNFLEIIFFLSDHPSKVIAQSALKSWIHILNHQKVRKDETMLELVPVLVDFVSKYLRKNKAVENKFTAVEAAYFSDSDEITSFENLHRNFVVDVLRLCSFAAPLVAIQKCLDYAENHLAASYTCVEELHHEFDGVVTFIDTVVSPVIRAVKDNDNIHSLPFARVENLVIALFSKKTDDVVLMLSYLSCAYGFCKLVALSKNAVYIFKLLIDYMFNILDKTAGMVASTSVVSLRRHVCSIMVRISRSDSNILVQFSDHIKMLLEQLSVSPSKLRTFEKASMFESLILISMEWNDFERQSSLIADIMATTNSIVESPAFIEALRGPVEFANTIGMGIVDPETENDVTAETRSQFYYYISIVFGVLNRSQGTKKDGYGEIQGPNPCVRHISKALDHVLMLSYLISSMWSPQMRIHVAPENLKSLDIRDCDKRHLICQTPELAKSDDGDERFKPHWERLQTFLVVTLDQCYMSLGLIGKTLGPSFYGIPQLQQIISQKVFVNVEFLTCLRFKSFLRHFFTMFLKFCPVEKIRDVISPLLQSYCMFLMERLQSAWDVYGKREFERLQGIEDINDAEEKEENEILEEQILRVLTRDHMNLLINVITNKYPSSHKSNGESNEVDMSNDVDMKSSENSHCDRLTELGAAIAASPCCEQVMKCALRALTWYDTTSCQKAFQLLNPLLNQLISYHAVMFNEEFTRFVLNSLLCGLARHGQHDGCEVPICSLLLMTIQRLQHLQAPLITEVLLSTQPEESKNKVTTFLKQFNDFSEKQRKLAFRKLLAHVIIRHAGQRFKESPTMNNLPPIIKRKKIKPNAEIESFDLASLFQPTS